jgi:hypothetical protein
MTLERLQRLNLFKRMSFSIIFVIIVFMIFVGIIDRSVIHLSFIEVNTKFSLEAENMFLTFVLFSMITQSIFFYKVYSENLPVRKRKIKSFYLVPLVCHFLNLALMTILITQIFEDSKYHKSIILFTIWINTSIGISILVALLYRFILWLKESTKKNIVVTSYIISILSFIILNVAILLYFNLGYQASTTYITSTTFPSNIFATPYDALAAATINLSIISFLLIWTSSVLLLIYGTGKLKKKYFIVMGFSLLIFLSHYIFLWAFSSMRISNFSMFYDIYIITSNISFPLGGIFFGFTFWILAKNLDILKDNNLERGQKIKRVKQSMYFSSIGIILLIFSFSPLDITKLPYPPFGLVSFSFMNVGSLSFSLGIYNLAVAIASSSNIRIGFKKKSEFLFSIGQSQDQLDKRNNIVGILAAFKNYILDTQTYEEGLDEDYFKEVLTERSKFINNLSKITFPKSETPLGRSWGTWIESWCKWYYYDLRELPAKEDKAYDKWIEDKENHEICYLTKPLIEPSENSIECEITIPKGRILFLPLINNLINFYDYPNLKSENDLKLFAKSDLDKKTIVFLSINDYEIKNIQQTRVQSNLFDITLPTSNDPSEKTKTQAIADGYWIFLRPLEAGISKIHFKMETYSSGNSLEENIHRPRKNRIMTDVRYKLNIIDN